jgi:DNA-binding IclR family transcriptional regulator
VERAFSIVELLVRSRRPWRVSEISRKLGVPKSTTHVLVTTLERLGYLTRGLDNRSYTSGMRVHELAQPWIGSLVLPDLAVSRLEWLVQQSRLTAHLATMGTDQAIYIHKVEGPGPARFDSYVGKRANLHCTAVGKVLLAFGPETVLQNYLAKGSFAHHTEKTITTAPVLYQEILKVRKRGFAIDDEEEELDVRCVAIPVFSPGGEVQVALGVTGMASQIHPENTRALLDLMKRAAAGIFVQERSLAVGA